MSVGGSRAKRVIVAQTATWNTTTAVTYDLGSVGESYDAALVLVNVTTATTGNVTVTLMGAVGGTTVYAALPSAATSALSTVTTSAFSYTGALPTNLQVKVVGASTPALVGDIYVELKKIGG